MNEENDNCIRNGSLPDGYNLSRDRGVYDLDVEPYDVYFGSELVTWGKNKQEAINNAWRHANGEIG